MTNFVEKTVLEELMPKFDTDLARKMMVNSIFLNDDMKNFATSPGDIEIQIRSIKDPSCFRIRFSLPNLLLFHISTKFLREIHGYYKYQNYTFPAGFIPAYNCNLNHLSLLRPYEKTFRWFEKIRANDDEDYFCKMFDNESGEPMEQSSLNFLLQNNSVSSEVSSQVSSLVNSCFEFLYWRPPLGDYRYRYSTIHNFVYHSSSRIFVVRRIFKTVAKIIELGKKRYPLGNPKKFDYVQAKASIMCQDDNELFFKNVSLIVAEPDASRIEPSDFITCIMEKPIMKNQSNMPLIIHGIIGPVIKNPDLAHLISAVIWKSLHPIEESKLCRVGSYEQIKKLVFSLLENNQTVFDNEWISNFDNLFSTCLKKLYPLILETDGMVYHIPPPLVAFILTREIPVMENKSELLKFLNFVDLMDPKTRARVLTILRNSDLGAEIQTGSCSSKWGILIKELPRVGNRIIYSRVFSRFSSAIL